MNILALWRQEIEALLPCGFLKISRDGAFLFVSDYPLRAQDPFAVRRRVEEAGFLVLEKEGKAFLDASPARYARAAAQAQAPPEIKTTEENRRLCFAARLLLASPVAPESQSIPLIRHTLRCTALNDHAGLCRLPAMIAAHKRAHLPLAPLAGHVLLSYLAQQTGGSPC